MRKTLRSSEHDRFRAVMVEARHRAGLTQQALAAVIERPQSFVAKYEAGERRVDVVEFIAIARALRADPIKLMRKLVRA